MDIKRDWVMGFDEEQFMRAQGGSLQRLLQSPQRQAAWEEALADARQLVRPAAAWDLFPIRDFRHEYLILQNGTRIGGGPVVTVVGGAESLVVAVCTVGKGIDERVNEYQKNGKIFQAMMLSDLGSWAVDMVRQQFCRWMEDEATAQGRRVSAALSPGESIWSVKDQATIFALVDAGEIGVTLSPSMVMTPIKSLTLIMGTGAQPMGVEGASNCDFCTIAERCSFRHMRPEGHG